MPLTLSIGPSIGIEKPFVTGLRSPRQTDEGVEAGALGGLFPLVLIKGICHHGKYVQFASGLKQEGYDFGHWQLFRCLSLGLSLCLRLCLSKAFEMSRAFSRRASLYLMVLRPFEMFEALSKAIVVTTVVIRV